MYIYLIMFYKRTSIHVFVTQELSIMCSSYLHNGLTFFNLWSPSWRGSVRDIIFSFEVPFYYVCHSLQTLITFQVLLQKTWSIISPCVEDLPKMSRR